MNNNIYNKNKSWNPGDLIAFNPEFIKDLRKVDQYDCIIAFYVNADYKNKKIEEIKKIVDFMLIYIICQQILYF